MGKQLKLALNTGYWAGGPPAGVVEAIARGGTTGVRFGVVFGGVRLGCTYPTCLVG